jgi:hypothetical protein
MDLTWDAPPDCPTGAEIRADVTRIVGEKERRQVTVVATARREGSAWLLDLRTRAGDDEGERSLRGATCSEVAKAAVVVIALTIDPNVLTAPPPPLPLPPPQPPPSPPPPPPPPPKPAPRSVFATARISAGASFLTPPDVAPAIAAAGGVRFGRLAAKAGAVFAAETSRASAYPPAAGSFWSLGLFLRACAAPILAPRFEAWACAGFEANRLAARGTGVTNPTQTDVWFGAPDLAIEPAFVLAPSLRAVFPVEIAFPLDRPTFTIDGIGPVFTPPAALFRVTLGIEVLF